MRVTTVVLSSLLALGAAADTQAQAVGAEIPNSGPVADESPDSTPVLQEITVTAQKRSESLQRVAAAVSVVGNERLVEQGVTDLNQVSNLASGLSITPVRSQAFIFIRGVGQTLTSPNADAAVAVNLNGVYLPAEIAGTAFYDVDRIEILRGPQGTLYGRNSTGGVINISSIAPGETFGIDGFVEAGNYDRRQTVVGIDVPLASGLASRTALNVVQHDGYMNNGEDDQRTSAVRETLGWEPSDRTKITAIASYTRDRGVGNVLQNVPYQECGSRCAGFDPRALDYFVRANVFEASLHADQLLSDSVTLTYVGGYSRLGHDIRNSIFTGPPLAPLLLNQTISSQSHEARVNVDMTQLQGILGVYYFDQAASYRQDATPTPSQHLINPFDGKSNGSAVFGQATYSVLEALRLTAGLRFSHTVKDIDGFNSTFNAAGNQILFRPYAGNSSLDRLDWKVGDEYDLTSTTMIYANIQTGFTPGGFSTGPAVIGQPQAASFRPVTLRAFSGGIKSRSADGPITLNLEGFYYSYNDYQVSARDVLTAQNLVFNAPKATVYGAQLDSQASLGHGALSVSVTGLHAVADRLRTPLGNFDGYDLPYSPRWSVNALYQHAFDVAGGAQIRGSVNFKYASSRWAIYTHAPGFDIDSNTHIDVNLGYFAAGDRWSLQAFVRNAEDDVVKTTCGNALPGLAGCLFEAPRTYGLTVGFKLNP